MAAMEGGRRVIFVVSQKTSESPHYNSEGTACTSRRPPRLRVAHTAPAWWRDPSRGSWLRPECVRPGKRPPRPCGGPFSGAGEGATEGGRGPASPSPLGCARRTCPGRVTHVGGSILHHITSKRVSIGGASERAMASP